MASQIELKTYLLIGTFLISLLIDIAFSIKRKEWRFFTFSIFGILALIFVFYRGITDYIYWPECEWWGPRTLSTILYILFPSIIYFSFQLMFKIDLEKDSAISFNLSDYLNSRRKKEDI